MDSTGARSISEESKPGNRFEGQVAVVTGCGDRGIGAAVAERFASEGASVVLLSRSEPHRLQRRLDRHQRDYLSLRCDVTCADSIAAAFEEIQQWRDELHILVNNAGIETAKRLDDCTENDWRPVIDVNLNGAIATTRAALDVMASPGGVIINVSSALAQAGCPGFSVYSASKAGLNGFTQSLAWELAPRGIRVVGVAPGFVNTPMTRHYGEHLTHELWEQLQACHPLGIASPHEVAAPIAFFASREAQWITGVTVPLGFTPQLPLPMTALLDAAAAEAPRRVPR